MTRHDALNELNLPDDAGNDDAENAYRRLVRRYPPEFNPERFQKIDAAYRFLTSLPDMVEQLLSNVTESTLSASDFRFSAVLTPDAVDDALMSLSRSTRIAKLWPTGKSVAQK